MGKTKGKNAGIAGKKMAAYPTHEEKRCRCPECKQEYQGIIEIEDPPPKVDGVYLVFCPTCVATIYDFGRVPQKDSENWQKTRKKTVAERDGMGISGTNSPGCGYSTEENLYLHAIEAYKSMSGKKHLRATDYFLVLRQLGYKKEGSAYVEPK